MQKIRTAQASVTKPSTCEVPAELLLGLLKSANINDRETQAQLRALRLHVSDADVIAGWKTFGDGSDARSDGIVYFATLFGGGERDDIGIIKAAKAAELPSHYPVMDIQLDLIRGTGALPRRHHRDPYKLDNSPEIRERVAAAAGEAPLAGVRDLLALAYAKSAQTDCVCPFTPQRVATALRQTSPNDFMTVCESWPKEHNLPQDQRAEKYRVMYPVAASLPQCKAVLEGTPHRHDWQLSPPWTMIANARRAMSDDAAVEFITSLSPINEESLDYQVMARSSFLVIPPHGQRNDAVIRTAFDAIQSIDTAESAASLWPIYRDQIHGEPKPGLSSYQVADMLLDKNELSQIGSALVQVYYGSRKEPAADGTMGGKLPSEWQSATRAARVLLGESNAGNDFDAATMDRGMWPSPAWLAQELLSNKPENAATFIQTMAGQTPTAAMFERIKKQGIIKAALGPGGERFLTALRAAPDDQKSALAAKIIERMNDGAKGFDTTECLRVVAHLAPSL